MALQTAQVTVGTTPVELTAPLADTYSNSAIIVQAPAAATLYVGPAGVTPATGFPVAAGTTVSGDLENTERLYGVLASGTGTAYVLRSGV